MAKMRKVIVMVDSSRAYGRGLLQGIGKYSRLHGPWIFFQPPPFYRLGRDQTSILRQMKNWGANGIIMRENDLTEDILRFKRPTIIAPYSRKQIRNFPCIVSNGRNIGKMATDYFLERKFWNVAYCGFEDMPWSRDRCDGFCERAAMLDIQVAIYKQPKSKKTIKNEQKYLVDWLRILPKPTGIMACNDDRGQEIAEACKIAGLHVPDEVAILGVDNDQVVCDLCNPPLSSINRNAERAGYEAAKCLERLMDGEKMTGQIIEVKPTHIVTRQSTDIMMIEDHEVLQAIRFIQDHVGEGIQVDDVAKEVALSRRTLQQRFKKMLGYSVHNKIVSSRIERACKLLVETNMSATQIAVSLGYPELKYISRSFQKETGMSPLAYRKKYGLK